MGGPRAVDLLGLGVTIGVNAALVAVIATAVTAFGRSSWFTDPRFKLGGRGPESLSGVLLIVLGASFLAWGWAWERPSVASWRVQNVLAVWCCLLTAFHAVGIASVVL